jgi:hypothetical protein
VTAEDRPLDRLLQVGVGQHHEGIGAAEFHRGLLQRLGCLGCDYRSSVL